MPMYPNYLQMNNPYMDRMNYMPSYQQMAQQNMAGTQMSLPNQPPINLGKMVDSLDVVKATDIPMDGNMYYFPKADGTEIFGKQWLQNGTTRILTYKPIFDDNPNNLSSNGEKLKFDLSDEVTKAFMDRFDNLENAINEFISKKTSSRVKKESDAE